MEEPIKRLQDSINALECNIQYLKDKITDSKTNLKIEEEELQKNKSAIEQCREAIAVLKEAK